VAEYMAADRALAELGIREIEAGIHDETPEFLAANGRVVDAECAMPWVVFFFAEPLASRRNRDAWERMWAAEGQAIAMREGSES
jgi:hypothetical protein